MATILWTRHEDDRGHQVSRRGEPAHGLSSWRWRGCPCPNTLQMRRRPPAESVHRVPCLCPLAGRRSHGSRCSNVGVRSPHRLGWSTGDPALLGLSLTLCSAEGLQVFPANEEEWWAVCPPTEGHCPLPEALEVPSSIVPGDDGEEPAAGPPDEAGNRGCLAPRTGNRTSLKLLFNLKTNSAP